MTKSDVNPMQRAHAAPRCTAHAKRTGFLCKNPAVRGWRVCRMHGAHGGQPPGSGHPSFKHGMRAKQTVELRRAIQMLNRHCHDHLDGME